VPVYEALGIEWEPSTSGDLTGTGATVEQVQHAILDQFEHRFDLTPSSISDDTLELAISLLDAHQPSLSG
jgi:lipoate-protein ligase A